MREIVYKCIFPFLLLLILASSNQVLAANTMVMGSASTGPNQEITLPVSITNDSPFVAFQFDMQIPQGFVYVANSAIIDVARTNGHSLQASVLDGNILRILGYSLSNAAFKGNSGNIVAFKLRSNAIPGNYSLNLTAPIIGNAATSNILTSSSNGTLTLLAPDINLAISALDFDRTPLGQYTDRTISVSNTGNQPLRVTNITFDNSNFSIVGNSAFTIPANQTAIVSVRFTSVTKGFYNNHVTLLTNDPDEASVTVELTSHAYAVNQIHTGTIFAYSGHNATLNFSIKNMEAFTGFQFDLILPSAIIYMPGSAALSNRKTNHLVSANMINSNTLRVVAFSANNQAFTGTDGQVLTLGFSALGIGGNYSITMQNALIGDAGGLNIISDSYSGQLQIAAASLICNSTVVFGDVSVISTGLQNLTISNTGSDTLKISQLEFTNPVFSSSIVLPIKIISGQQKNIPVVCHPLTRGNVTGTLKIISNDPVKSINPVSLSANVYVPNTLVLPDITSYNNDTLRIPVKINNLEAFTGFQFDLSFPAYLTYIDNSAELTGRSQGHMLQSAFVSSTKIRVIAFSMQQSPFLSDTGAVVLLSFAVHATNNETSGPLTLSNSILGNAQSQNILYSVTNGLLTIKPAIPLGIEDAKSILKQCTVFPTPATEVLNIEMMLEQNAGLVIAIMDLQGRTYRAEAMGEISSGKSVFRIKTTGIPNGVYTLKLTASVRNKVSTYFYKIIISK